MTAPWPPPLCSAPLNEDFPSLFRRYRDAFRIAWQQARGYQLEEWQEELLCAITELRPDGRLRWRQVLVSLGRQNGKTEIAAALGLLFLLWKATALVIGIASSADQARLVYDRAMQVIRGNPSLAKKYQKLTETRGIKSKAGGAYEMKAAKSAALQGIPIDLGIVDEVHLLKMSLWTDLVNGTGGRPDCLVVGITTAGDDSSVLLKHLYEVESESVGKFIWHAPEARVPDDDVTLLEYLRAANPAVASGRVDERIVLEDVRSMPEEDVIRYRLNRFVSGASGFMPASLWAKCEREPGEVFPEVSRPVFAVDRTPSWSAATITVSKKVGDVIWTEIVASIPNPTSESLKRVCDVIASRKTGDWVLDGYLLPDLAEHFKKRGRSVRIARLGDAMAASALLYRYASSRKLKHAGDPLLRLQVPGAGRKNVREGFRIIAGNGEIDAVMATAYGVWACEVQKENPVAIR